MTWAALFERADDSETDLAAIRTALAERRDGAE
jgi:hypothetical protein